MGFLSLYIVFGPSSFFPLSTSVLHFLPGLRNFRGAFSRHAQGLDSVPVGETRGTITVGALGVGGDKESEPL